MVVSRASGNHYDVGGVLLQRPFKARRLGHFALWQQDIDAARRFYTDLLGFRGTDYIRGPDGDPLAMFTSHGTDHHSFVAINPSTATGARKDYYDKGIKVNQISFQVGTLEEVVRAHSYFSQLQVPISRIGRDFPGSNWALYVFDPDGHRIEFYYGMEQIGWTRHSKPRAAYLPLPFDVPPLPQMCEMAEVVASEKAGVDLTSGFKDVDTSSYEFEVGGVRMSRPFKVSKVGPVSIFVADIDNSERFYVDFLGLHKTEEIIYRGQRCVYLRVGTDHHSIALLPIALREVLGLDCTTSLLSFGVELGSYSQLRNAVDYLEGKGARFTDAIPAELHPGIDYAAYVLAEDGHVVQLYFGMEQIGWDGKPRPAEMRQPVDRPWPEAIEETSDTFLDLTIQGPME